MKKNEIAVPAEEAMEKKRPGRRPMTAAEKEAAAKQRAAEKKKAENLKPEILMQYQGDEVDLTALTEAAKADFHNEKKRTLITELKLYIKPEERMAYYVVNGSFEGKLSF